MEILLIWLLFGIVSGIIAANKGHNAAGYFLAGVVLGPFGLILAAAVKEDPRGLERKAVNAGQRKCPYCAELIKAEAVKCRFCGSEVEPAPAPKAAPSPPPRSAMTQAELARRNRQAGWAIGVVVLLLILGIAANTAFRVATAGGNPPHREVARWESGDAAASFRVVESDGEPRIVMILTDDGGAERMVLMEGADDLRRLRDKVTAAIEATESSKEKKTND